MVRKGSLSLAWSFRCFTMRWRRILPITRNSGAVFGPRDNPTRTPHFYREIANERACENFRLMQLARVIGTVVATQKVAGLEGVKLLLVQPLDRKEQPIGEAVVAADGLASAGPGELVNIVASREASLALVEKFVPVDHAIVGIVDQVDPARGERR